MGLFRKQEEYTEKMIRESRLEERKRKTQLENSDNYNSEEHTDPVITEDKPKVSDHHVELSKIPSREFDRKSDKISDRRTLRLIGIIIGLLYVAIRWNISSFDFSEDETIQDNSSSIYELNDYSFADNISSFDSAKLRFYSCAANSQEYYNSKRAYFDDDEFNVIFEQTSGYETYVENEMYYAIKEVGNTDFVMAKLASDYCFYSYVFYDDNNLYYISVEDNAPYIEVHDKETEDWGIYYFNKGDVGSFHEDYTSNDSIDFDEVLVLTKYKEFELHFESYFGFNPIDTPSDSSKVNN